MNCGSCRFFQNSGKFGMCQRYPEYVMKQDGMWCGEYQKREQAVVSDESVSVPVYTPETLPDTPKRRGRPPKNDQATS